MVLVSRYSKCMCLKHVYHAFLPTPPMKRSFCKIRRHMAYCVNALRCLVADMHIEGNGQISAFCRLEPLGCSQREAREAGSGNQVPGFWGQYFVIHADHHRM